MNSHQRRVARRGGNAGRAVKDWRRGIDRLYAIIQRDGKVPFGEIPIALAEMVAASDQREKPYPERWYRRLVRLYLKEKGRL